MDMIAPGIIEPVYVSEDIFVNDAMTAAGAFINEDGSSPPVPIVTSTSNNLLLMGVG